MSLLGINLQGASGSSAGGSINSGYNYGYTDSIGQSWGSGWSNDWGWSNSAENSMSEWGGYENGESWQHTMGREASAQDIMNAYTANSVERELWALQAAYNAQEAEKSRQFQAQMSNTAYQRAVEDLKKAGLNPILAAGVASSTPVGATASAGLSSAHKANAYAESVGGSYHTARNSGYSQSNGYSNSQWGGSSGYSNGSYNKSHSYNYGQNSGSSWERASYTNNIREIAGTAMGTLQNLTNAAVAGLKGGLSNYTKSLQTSKSPLNGKAGNNRTNLVNQIYGKYDGSNFKRLN